VVFDDDGLIYDRRLLPLAIGLGSDRFRHDGLSVIDVQVQHVIAILLIFPTGGLSLALDDVGLRGFEVLSG
jgi:hypothetical protein